jgi:hypothetical protein
MNKLTDVRFEGFTAMTMKNAVFWDVAPCSSLQLPAHAGHRSWIFSLKMEAIRSSETSVKKISTRRHIPENGILQIDKYP